MTMGRVKFFMSSAIIGRAEDMAKENLWSGAKWTGSNTGMHEKSKTAPSEKLNCKGRTLPNSKAYPPADGKTYKEALANVEIIIQEWLDTAKELGRPIPAPRGRHDSA